MACRARRGGLAGLLLGLPLLASACAPAATLPSADAAFQGPVLLISVEGLRLDAVGALGGEPGLTPNLDRLAAQSSWAGAGIAASSWLTPSMASVLTGLRPIQHGAISGQEKSLGADFLTLAEALSQHGYRSRAYHDTPGLAAAYGYGQGFESMLAFRRGQRAELDLRSLSGGPDFVWVHLGLPSPPFVRRDIFAGQLPPTPPGLPRRIGGTSLERYYDPSVPLPPAERERLWALYRYNVVAADAFIGQLLAALEASGQADEAWIVVLSAYGQEFGEHGQIGQGGHLGRELIEVPLLLRLPKSSPRHLALSAGERPALSRLWATLVEAVGGKAPPGAAPSLFYPSGRGVLSELFLAGGTNEVSWLEGDLQLRWRHQFADAGEDYFRLRLAAIGGGQNPARQAFRARMTALHPAFHAASKLGEPGATTSLLVERWRRQGVELIEDAALRVALGERLREAFSTFEKDSP